MLKGISPLLSPELLKVLCEMGHGDTIVLGDAHFPSHTLGPRVLRADGIKIPDLLAGIFPLFELDSYVPDPVRMMRAVEGDSLDMDYVASCRSALGGASVSLVDRFDFYDMARRAIVIVHSGETRKYGNVILQKGVIPC